MTTHAGRLGNRSEAGWHLVGASQVRDTPLYTYLGLVEMMTVGERYSGIRFASR